LPSVPAGFSRSVRASPWASGVRIVFISLQGFL